MKKVIIQDQLLDDLVSELSFDDISDLDITEALGRMRQRGVEIPKGETVDCYQTVGFDTVVWIEE